MLPVYITWHKKKKLGCVVCSHILTNDSYNKCIHSCFCFGITLPGNYVTKPFGMLQRVIKRQKTLISFGHSKGQYLLSQEYLWLKFQTCFEICRCHEKVKIPNSDHTMGSFQEKYFLLCSDEKMSPHFKLHIKLSETLADFFLEMMNTGNKSATSNDKLDLEVYWCYIW